MSNHLPTGKFGPIREIITEAVCHRWFKPSCLTVVNNNNNINNYININFCNNNNISFSNNNNFNFSNSNNINFSNSNNINFSNSNSNSNNINLSNINEVLSMKMVLIMIMYID